MPLTLTVERLICEAPWATLKELSATHPKMGEPIQYAYDDEETSLFNAINFEALMVRWYGPEQKNKNRPARCDAFYYDNNKFRYFIEFKSGSVESLQTHRKLYDSIIALVEFCGETFQVLREKAYYFVVRKNIVGTKIERFITSRIGAMIERPWLSPEYKGDDNDLHLQNGVTVRKACVITPRHFKCLVKDWMQECES